MFRVFKAFAFFETVEKQTNDRRDDETLGDNSAALYSQLPKQIAIPLHHVRLIQRQPINRSTFRALELFPWGHLNRTTTKSHQ